MQINGAKWATGAILGTAIGGLVLYFGAFDQAMPDIPSPPAIKASSIVALQGMPSPASAAPHYGNVKAKGNDTPADWKTLYTADDPYAVMVALYEARRPGSFAAVMEIQRACYRFWLDMDSVAIGRQHLLGPVNAPRYAARLDALNRLQTRCARFRDESNFAFMTPRADDPDGIRYKVALMHMSDTGGYTRDEKLREVVKEFADQGQLPILLEWPLVAESPIIKELNVNNTDELARAIEIVKLRMTSSPEMRTQDFRLAYACIRFGRCRYDYDQLSSSYSEDAQARILDAANRLEAAMRGENAAKEVFGL